MSLFSRIAGWFRSPGPPRLLLDGHAAWWPGQSYPLNVWVDGYTSELSMAAIAVHGMPGAALMFPTLLADSTRNVFFGSRDTFRDAIVIQPYVLTGSPGAFRCTTDLRYDKRTGELRNAFIEWNIHPGSLADNVSRLRHELGHCLGLGHCDGTIMQAQVKPEEWARIDRFNEEQQAYMRGLRK